MNPYGLDYSSLNPQCLLYLASTFSRVTQNCARPFSLHAALCRGLQALVRTGHAESSRLFKVKRHILNLKSNKQDNAQKVCYTGMREKRRGEYSSNGGAQA